MAEDNGSILLGAGPADVAASIKAQADAQARAVALRVQYDDLKDYKVLVDDLLTSLKESPAHHGKLADGTLPPGALGKDFPAAEKLYESYNTVHTELQKLSKGLSVQIEALGIAILTAGKSYDDVDEETKRRMLALAKQAKDQYVRTRDPDADKYGASPQGTPNDPQTNGTGKGGVIG